jgi:glycosyltransferase involved in cell wall biosynthesis
MNAVVINFNAPELNHLASHLALNKELCAYVRTYVNKDRLWERALGRLPFAGALYESTFGRRRIGNPELLALTRETGLGTELVRATLARSERVPPPIAKAWGTALQDTLRSAVSEAGRRAALNANRVVAHLGFGLPAFRAIGKRSGALCVLNYSSVHHRAQRAAVALEKEREPGFARSWDSFDAPWKPGYEAQLDEEIALADLVLVGSSYARETFLAAGVADSKLCIVPYGVDGSFFRPAGNHATRRSAFRIMYAGGLYQGKGLSYLLRAFERVRSPDSELVLVGNFTGGAEPFSLHRTLFRHVPHCTRRELAELYRGSDIFVFPTLSDGMGLVVLEAMASGLPVIVTPNGPGDLVRDGIDGFVVPARDEAALAHAIATLRDDPALRASMGRQARERACEFTWERYASTVRGLLA